MSCLRDLRAVWRTLVIIFTPLFLCPLVLPGTSQESKCSFVLAIMAVYWITEALPLPVTALLPVLLLPLLGLMPSKAVCPIYFKDVIFLLIGGLIVAIAIEESNLHKRFALRLLLLLGVQPRKLLLGFMLATGFLSMWITNTATTAMMTPIARALLARLFKAQRRQRHESKHLRENETAFCPVDSHEEHADIAETTFSWPVCTHDKDTDISALEKGLDSGAEREILITSNETNGTDRNKSDLDLDKNTHNQADDKFPRGKQTAEHEEIDDNDEESDDEDEEIDLNVEKMDKRSADLVKALCLSVCYSANIGGVGTLTGTGPNLVFKNYVELLSNGEDQVSFVSWMAFGAPVAAINLALAWLWMQLFFFGVANTLLCRRQTRPEEEQALTQYLRREHSKLGKMSFSEKVVLGHFLMLVVLWLTRSPGVFTGWSIFFSKGYVSDAVPAILMAISLFVFSREKPAIFCCPGKRDPEAVYVSSPSIVQWSPLSRKFPWGVVLLLGGGFALAEATKVSGLSDLIAQQMMVIGNFPAWGACVVVVVATSITTEITSNTVIATLLLPILAQVAASMGLHPIYFMLPSTVASSFAFMLPVATPPNAIVFAHGDIKVLDMVKTGVALNIICIAVVTVAINTFGRAYFRLDQVPDWSFRLLLNGSTPFMNMHNSTSAAPDWLSYNVSAAF